MQVEPELEDELKTSAHILASRRQANRMLSEGLDSVERQKESIGQALEALVGQKASNRCPLLNLF